MRTVIQALNTELVHRMAAGEVIDSMGAVVRELIDNALDAAATRLTITLGSDLQSVEVTDNGHGLTWVDLQVVALPHTTSKISRFEHLSGLSTLGFRGEALHSLAQLGQLRICSRATDASTGWRIHYDRKGCVLEATEVAMAVGTTVTVTHLFETWPSRQDNGVSPTQTLRSIQGMIGDYALCHPQVTWQVYHQQRLWFSLAPGANAKDILLQIMSKWVMSKLAPEDLRSAVFHPAVPPEGAITAEGVPPTARVEVLLGLPDRYHRHRADWVRVAVNGRRAFVNTLSAADQWNFGPLEQSILSAFRQTVPRHRYPLCWVHLQVPSAFLDWNRTASKSQLYLHQLDYWKAEMVVGIQTTLQLEPEDSSPQVRQLLKSAEPKGRYTLTPLLNLSSPLPQASDLPSDAELFEAGMVGELKAIAQLHQTYIVAEHPTGLWLVEQHIAHERVLYERLVHQWEQATLDTPLVLCDLTERQVQALEGMGLTVDAFGPDLWAVRTVPKPLVEREDCLEAVYELSRCADFQAAVVATACHNAIRNGQPLSLNEMQQLLEQWQQTQQPRTCPHGRPIALRLEEQALAKFFRRHWVIGKSHGI